jgi:hypothetical protein
MACQDKITENVSWCSEFVWLEDNLISLTVQRARRRKLQALECCSLTAAEILDEPLVTFLRSFWSNYFSLVSTNMIPINRNCYSTEGFNRNHSPCSLACCAVFSPMHSTSSIPLETSTTHSRQLFFSFFSTSISCRSTWKVSIDSSSR